MIRDISRSPGTSQKPSALEYHPNAQFQFAGIVTSLRMAEVSRTESVVNAEKMQYRLNLEIYIGFRVEKREAMSE